MIRYYRTAGGTFLGAFDAPPPGGIEVAFPPRHAGATWTGEHWVEPPPPPHKVLRGTIVDRLIAAGLDDEAEAALTLAGAQTRRRWESRWWVWSNDPDAVAIMTVIGADAAVILAPDPDAPA